ncbi:hypothetical protein MUP00_09300, partial [Candidatus Bathyarchaeota archaeon]|nr:hypothetical protein [Candidatus Bathyarchaeota archaeon]
WGLGSTSYDRPVAAVVNDHLAPMLARAQLIEKQCLDVLQPDIHWVGGLSECVKICHMAESAGLIVCLHGGGNDPYGQHLSYAMPNTPWAEYFIASPPGVPLDEVKQVPGTSVPLDGTLRPSEEPGFGLGIEEEWLIPFDR